MRGRQVGRSWGLGGDSHEAGGPSDMCVCVFMCVSCSVQFRSFSSVAQSCLTLCDPMDCSPQGSSAHGILQARILEWVAIPFSRVRSMSFTKRAKASPQRLLNKGM